MVKGQVDRPGRELRSKCAPPEAVNRTCGVLPAGHDPEHCSVMSRKRAAVIRRMKELIQKLDNVKQCEQWDTWPTFNNTPGPHRFGFYQPREKPWSLGRVKSKELIASKLYRNCECIRKNGLQDSCPRTQCRGRPWCLQEPFPLCPPFTQKPCHTLSGRPEDCYGPPSVGGHYEKPDYRKNLSPDEPIRYGVQAVPCPNNDCMVRDRMYM